MLAKSRWLIQKREREGKEKVNLTSWGLNCFKAWLQGKHFRDCTRKTGKPRYFPTSFADVITIICVPTHKWKRHLMITMCTILCPFSKYTKHILGEPCLDSTVKELQLVRNYFSTSHVMVIIEDYLQGHKFYSEKSSHMHTYKTQNCRYFAYSINLFKFLVHSVGSKLGRLKGIPILLFSITIKPQC